MTITSVDGLVDAMGNNATTFQVNKSSLANTVAGQFFSLWQATGFPANGATPGAYAVCTSALTGAIGFTNPADPVKSYLARMFLMSANSATDIQVHDRLAHMGGLSGTTTPGAQNALVDVNVSTSNMVARRGASNFSDVQWWLEWYTATGATASNATVNVTYDDASTGNLAAIAVGGTVRAGRMIPLLPAVAGRFIRYVNTVTLSASTGTAGSFGVTATRALGGISLGLANSGIVADWAALGLPRIHDDACLQFVCIPGTTTTGALYGSGKIVQG